MKPPICVTNTCVTNWKQTGSFRIAVLLLAIAPLWLMLAVANTSAQAQTPNAVPNAAVTPSPGDWTQFLRDNMQRWNPYETVLNVNNVGNLQLKWKFDLGSMAGQFSSPAVANGVVYVGSSDNDSVYAVNASTGAKLWSFTTGGSVYSSPAVANGVVYFGAYDFAVTNQGYMYALNASTGAKLWAFGAGGNENNNYSEWSSPVVANGVVYVGNLGTGTDDVVYAVNASTGAKLWSYTAPGPVQVTSSPAVANGVVYIGSPTANSGGANDTLYALNTSTGALLWSFTPVFQYPLQYQIPLSSPAVANGVVYISSNDSEDETYDYVYALNGATGALLWSSNIPANPESTPAVANGVVYVGAGDGLYALNADTGVRLWSYDTGSGVISSPAVANGVVYIGSGNGDVYALNASTGAKLWSYAFGSPAEFGVESSPAVVDGVLYVTSGVSLYAFGLGAADTADLYLRIQPTPTTVHQGDLLTYAFPVWDLGPANAVHEVLTTHVPEGTTLDYVRISGTPGLGTCTTPPYEGTGEIVCHENSAMAPNTTWTVRLVVKVTAPSGTVITENATVTEDTPDPNLANNAATVSMTVQ